MHVPCIAKFHRVARGCPLRVFTASTPKWGSIVPIFVMIKIWQDIDTYSAEMY